MPEFFQKRTVIDGSVLQKKTRRLKKDDFVLLFKTKVVAVNQEEKKLRNIEKIKNVS